MVITHEKKPRVDLTTIVPLRMNSVGPKILMRLSIAGHLVKSAILVNADHPMELLLKSQVVAAIHVNLAIRENADHPMDAKNLVIIAAHVNKHIEEVNANVAETFTAFSG